MTDKCEANRAHDAAREEDRQRAVREVNARCDELERENARLRAERDEAVRDRATGRTSMAGIDALMREYPDATLADLWVPATEAVALDDRRDQLAKSRRRWIDAVSEGLGVLGDNEKAWNTPEELTAHLVAMRQERDILRARADDATARAEDAEDERDEARQLRDEAASGAGHALFERLNDLLVTLSWVDGEPREVAELVRLRISQAEERGARWTIDAMFAPNLCDEVESASRADTAARICEKARAK